MRDLGEIYILPALFPKISMIEPFLPSDRPKPPISNAISFFIPYLNPLPNLTPPKSQISAWNFHFRSRFPEIFHLIPKSPQNYTSNLGNITLLQLTKMSSVGRHRSDKVETVPCHPVPVPHRARIFRAVPCQCSACLCVRAMPGHPWEIGEIV